MEGEKKYSPIKLCVSLALLVLLLAILFIFFSGLKLEKSDNDEKGVKINSSSISSSSVISSHSSEENGEDESKFVEEDLNSVSSLGDNSEQSSGKESSSISMEKVSDIELGSEVSESSVIVSGKNVYKVNGVSYTYSLYLMFPDEGDVVVVEYFCSRKVFDAVNSGQMLVAEYQVDSDGLISVRTINTV